MSNTDKTVGTLKGKMMTDEDGKEHYIVGFRFEYTSTDGISVRFYIDPTTTDAGKWSTLVDAIKTNQPYEVSTCIMNGDVSMGHASGQVEMRAHRTGAGGDGDLQVTLPAAKCLEAIEKCAAAYAAHDYSLGASS
ncbi:hypothetical protein TW95_gp0600 [Pandoravirus inopinatum]|uniref:Uncharacterized protein n=1 Tax=Pandoravirus inopinatum TaxID=1605721 RepID=A0A0B5J1G3_9VIRU|nr:hypothetical protein TW95_gp0600 [Pandoravirus inopinatum]AJF97334.1 hypothetical protein [Pandoravirus inopinatum]